MFYANFSQSIVLRQDFTIRIPKGKRISMLTSLAICHAGAVTKDLPSSICINLFVLKYLKLIFGSTIFVMFVVLTDIKLISGMRKIDH